MSGSELFVDHFGRMDPELQEAIRTMADNTGFPVSVDPFRRRFCEALAVAARLGELSLRGGPPLRGEPEMMPQTVMEALQFLIGWKWATGTAVENGWLDRSNAAALEAHGERLAEEARSRLKGEAK